MLEVIDRGTCSESHPVPLLFVHGAWHAAWCWEHQRGPRAGIRTKDTAFKQISSDADGSRFRA
jgi:hypothetical protein